jgi:membrane protein YqaA with SNARE-associated domain
MALINNHHHTENLSPEACSRTEAHIKVLGVTYVSLRKINDERNGCGPLFMFLVFHLTALPVNFINYLFFILYYDKKYTVTSKMILRHCATNRNVAGSIPDYVIGIFIDNPFGRNMALELTQPVTEISTRYTSWE